MEQKLIGQADELVVLVDSSKFAQRSSLVLCPLNRITTVITDDELAAKINAMVNDSTMRERLQATSKAMQAEHGPSKAAQILDGLLGTA